MNEFDAIAFIVDTAIKHARHNQKSHGRRGGDSGAVQTAMDFGDGTTMLLAAGPGKIDPSTWKAHKPSARALALAEEFAAMADDPDGRFAKIQALKKIEENLQKKSAEYREARKLLREAKEFSEDESEIEKLSDKVEELRSDVGIVSEMWSRADDKVNDGTIQVHPLLALREGRSDIIQSVMRNNVNDAERMAVINKNAADWEREMSDITDKGIAAFHSIVGVEDPFSGKSGLVRVEKNMYGGYFDPQTNRVKVGPGGLLNNQHMTRVVAHELAHFAEFANPKMIGATIDFYETRTRGEKTRPLNEIWSERTGMPPSEGPYPAVLTGRGDKFPTLYSGLEYPARGNLPRSTEILSVGVELLLSDPVGFAKADPEYFTFVVDTIQTPGMYD